MKSSRYLPLLLLPLSSVLHSAPFGRTILSDGGAAASCAPYYVILDAPLVVSASSRVYVDATSVLGGISQQPPGQRISLAVVVTSQDGNQVLGTTADTTSLTGTYAIRGVLHGGITPWDVSAAPAELVPGQYRIQARYVFLYGSSNCAFNYGPLSLSYIVLSAVYDRVFADSFA